MQVGLVHSQRSSLKTRAVFRWKMGLDVEFPSKTVAELSKIKDEINKVVAGYGATGSVKLSDLINDIWTIVPEAWPKLMIQAGAGNRALLQQHTPSHCAPSCRSSVGITASARTR